jgi:hypothetical protein
MTERKKNFLMLATMLGIMLIFFSRILITNQIIRAPDIINESYWSVLELSKKTLLDFFNFPLSADWNLYGNSGNTLLGGEVGGNLASFTRLIYYFISPPASVAWFIVFHFFVGSCGVYFYCRAIGTTAQAALLGGLIFALAPEMASLINAGHVMKIATISFAPWAFFLLEKGFQRRRLIWFMATSIVLAFQFFNSHWQIAYYTCLAVGCYGVIGIIAVFREENDDGKKGMYKLLGMNLVTLCFFLSTVAISLIPLKQWSNDTNRGAQSGENSGKGGLNRDEAMSWSLPPEELAAFVVPGLFGLSRKEAGPNPDNIGAFYWGRMVFTQTTSYIGLLPWLLLPLSLIFRRDRYTLLATVAIVGGIIFSMGKYTFVYNLLFDYLPGINRFRVPKMMMFMPVIGLAVMAARGIDVLQDDDCRITKAFRRYLTGIVALPLLLLIVFASMKFGANNWLAFLADLIIQPARYEQGPALVLQRWGNMISETGITAALAAFYAVLLIVMSRKQSHSTALLLLLFSLFVADVWRINDKFMFLTDVPQNSKGIKSSTIDFLAKQSKQYRVLPINLDPSYFSSNNIPVMFTSMPVQQVRWQEILDTFSMLSIVPDILNVRYMVMQAEEYNRDKSQLGDRYKPVFTSPDGKEVVLENVNVLPKAWLVSSVFQLPNREQGLQILQNPAFNPRKIALIESTPPITMDKNPQTSNVKVVVDRYEGKRIDLSATTLVNSLLVLGEKYYQGWNAFVDGKRVQIYPVNNILRGVYLTPGTHKIEYVFDPLPFKIGKYLTLGSFVLFAGMLIREWRIRKKFSFR